MGFPRRVMAGAAVVGTVASVMVAGLLWLVVTRPESVAATVGAWLGGR